MKYPIAAVASVITLFVVGYLLVERDSSSPQEARPARPTAPVTDASQVLVTRDDATLPGACRPDRIAARLDAFFRAVSSGDRVTLDRLVGRGAQLKVYEINERGKGGRRRRFSSRRHDAVVRYLLRRRALGERIVLRQVEVGRGAPFHTDEEAGDEVIGANVVVSRRAPDLARFGVNTSVAGGKGAIGCDGPTVRFLVLAIGFEPPDLVANLCPRPRGERAPGKIIACAIPTSDETAAAAP